MVFLFALLPSTAGTTGLAYSCSTASLELLQEQLCSEEPWPEPAPVSIVPDALLMRQLTVLAWTGMHRVGDAQGAPTAAPQQPQTVLSASTPRPT